LLRKNRQGAQKRQPVITHKRSSRRSNPAHKAPTPQKQPPGIAKNTEN
jgi:hypothetical protein